MARIAERTGDFQTLVALLERRAEARRGREKAEALARRSPRSTRTTSRTSPRPTRRYEAVLAIDPHDLSALKGLDRIFNRTGKYRELLENLERQVAVAATPRQKINLYERMAGAPRRGVPRSRDAPPSASRRSSRIDGANDSALTALARHYRALGKWERLVELYEKHATVTSDDARRVELLDRARAYARRADRLAGARDARLRAGARDAARATPARSRRSRSCAR